MVKKTNKIRENIIKNIKIVFIILLFFIILGIVFNGNNAHAGENTSPKTESTIAIVLGWVVYPLIYFVGLFASWLTEILVSIAQFSNFINADPVVRGWVIVRDLCNMFFILVLLIIAFATILRIESYPAKKLLPKLLIMAVLINFSKTICGLFIDFSQVIMLTFVNGFGTAGNNFVDIFGMKSFLSSKEVYKDGIKEINTVAGLLSALLFCIIVLIVLVVLIAVLVMRIIMLWIYTILSPIAFLASAFPAGQKYSQQWWGEFSKQVIVGPVLAFFIWLALITAGKVTIATATNKCAGISEFLCDAQFSKFIVAIGLLIGGLMVTQQMGGVAASIAGKGMQWARKAPVLMGAGTLGLAGWGGRKLKAWKGIEIRPTKIIAGIKEGLAEKKRKEEIEGEAKSAQALRRGGVMGLVKGLGASRDLTESAARGFLYHRAWFGKKSVAAQAVKAGGLRKDISRLEKKEQDLEGRAAKAENEEQKKKILAEKEGISNQIKQKNKELSEARTPYTYFADQKRMSAISEEMKKIGNDDNEEHLVEMFNAAVAKGDKELASAVYIHAAKVGHANEIIHSQRATEDVKDEYGNVKTEAGHTLDESVYGMHALTNQTLIKKLGMSEQEALSVQSQVSTLAKAVGHYNLAESVGERNGMLYQRTGAVQQRRATNELRKRDPERSVRDYNRLSYGDEIQTEVDGNVTGRQFRLSQLGKANLLEWADSISKEVKNRRFNKNAAMNLATAVDSKGNVGGGLREFYRQLKKQGKNKFYDAEQKQERDYKEVFMEIEKYGKMALEGRERAAEQTEIAAKLAAGGGEVAGGDEEGWGEEEKPTPFANA